LGRCTHPLPPVVSSPKVIKATLAVEFFGGEFVGGRRMLEWVVVHAG
jgi:hypothetical protein